MSVELNTFSNVSVNICVLLFILIISLMALNPSIGYSIYTEVTRYGTFNVAEFVSSPTWTFKLVHPKYGICVLLPTLLWSYNHSLTSLSMVLRLFQGNFLSNRIFVLYKLVPQCLVTSQFGFCLLYIWLNTFHLQVPQPSQAVTNWSWTNMIGQFSLACVPLNLLQTDMDFCDLANVFLLTLFATIIYSFT